MIVVEVTCGYEPCGLTERTVMTGNQIYGAILVKKAVPRHWLVRTPKEGDAIAYCPEHRLASDRPLQRDYHRV